MISFIWAHVRRRAVRSGTLLLGILVATTGFTVLTGTTQTSRLEVTGAVEASTHAAYDILVRPKGSRTALEDEAALVRPNYLSGIFGGITPWQYEQTASVPGVEVAAPIAMAGYVNVHMYSHFDVTDLVDRDAEQQLIRIDRTYSANNDMSRAEARPQYLYLTKKALSWVLEGEFVNNQARFSGGEVRPIEDMCGDGLAVLENGRPLCVHPLVKESTELDDRGVVVARLRPDGRFQNHYDDVSDRLVVTVGWRVPMLLAAVDPEAEDRLVGLRGAVGAGRYLTAGEGTETREVERRLPALVADRLYGDNNVEVKVSRAGLNTSLTGVSSEKLTAALDRVPTTRTRGAAGNPAEAFRRSTVEALAGNSTWGIDRLLQTGATSYDGQPGGTLTAKPVPVDPKAYQVPGRAEVMPWQVGDTGFRQIGAVPPPDDAIGVVRVVGTFDPERVAGFNPLSKVPLETYEPPGASGADDATRDLLGGRPLRPDGNPAGYLASPPLLLTTTEALTDWFTTADSPRSADPISAVRVRVSGARDFSEKSREQVRVVAEQIATRTGLDVDITYGSSQAPQEVALAAGKYGRPALLLTEGWSKKGVATAIISAVDRKSALLFVLVLVVCALFLLNAASAAVRNRRGELAVLVTLGWPARRIAGVVLGELLLIGLAAGLASLALAWPLGAALDIGVSAGQAALAVPVAVILALTAGIVPAMRAARVRPAETLRPAVTAPRRARPARWVTTMGLSNLTRTPGRTLLGAAALAIGIASLTVLLSVTWAFHGAVVGTVLGDEVSVRARGVDAGAVVTIVLLGVLAVADLLYLNVSERAAELAALRVTGWPPTTLARLVATEGFGIGVLGALAGAGTGLAAVAWLTGEVPQRLLTGAALAAAVGIVLVTVAALVPAALQNRTSAARVLAEE